MKKNSNSKTSKTEILFKGKKRNLPKSIDRLNVFRNQIMFETRFGSVKLSKPLTQTNRDILDAIAATGKAGDKDGRKAYAFDPAEVMRALGFKATHENYKWLDKKLDDMAQITMRIKTEKLEMIGHIIDFVLLDYREKELPEYLKVFGKSYIWLLVFSEEFTKMHKQDYVLWSDPDILKQLVLIKQGYIKAIIRFCFTNRQVNIKLRDLLNYTGYKDISVQYYRRIKSNLIKNTDILKEKFNITVVEKNHDLFIFYKQNPRIIAIDYRPDESNI